MTRPTPFPRGTRPAPRAPGVAAPRAFSLIELMVVVGIIGLLVAILLPALGKVRERGWRVQCANNLRAICMATRSYATDNADSLPYPNWITQENNNRPRGWLYTAPNRGLANGVAAPEHLRAGLLWPYIESVQPYRCPVHLPPYSAIVSGIQKGPTESITSYLMNGAIIGYGRLDEPWHIQTFRPDAILYWEAQELLSAPYNDGASFPNESATDRHGAGSTFGCADGHVEYIYLTDYKLEQNRAPGRLWCYPGSVNGQ